MNEFKAGLFAGLGSTIVGHPLDTIKVRVQTENKSIIKSIKSKNLLSGLRYPLYTNALQHGIIFSSYNVSRSLFKNDINYKTDFLCGAIAGINNSFLCSPVEYIKIQLQKSNIKYKTSRQCFINLVENGTLYRGLLQTLIRDSISYGCYFSTYNYLQNNLKKKYKDNKLPSYYSLISGGIGGLTCWISSYPVDIIKTVYQSNDKLNLHQTHKFIIKNGYIGYWKGLLPCLIRAFVVNGSAFYFYEMSLKLF